MTVDNETNFLLCQDVMIAHLVFILKAYCSTRVQFADSEDLNQAALKHAV